MDVQSRLEKLDGKRRGALRGEYRQLLGKLDADKADTKSIGRLGEVCRLLSIGPSAAQADVSAMHQAAALEAELAKPDTTADLHAKWKAAVAALKAHQDFLLIEGPKTERRLQSEVIRLATAFQEAGAARTAKQEKLVALKRGHPLVFDPDPTPTPPPAPTPPAQASFGPGLPVAQRRGVIPLPQ